MAKISMATVRALINYLRQQNTSTVEQESAAEQDNSFCCTKLLASIGLNELALNQSSLLIDSTKYETIFSFAERELNLTHIGFEFGKTITADRWGILGYIAVTSPTLKMALQKQRKYQSLVGNLGTPISTLEKNNLMLKWIPAYQCNHHIVEEIITGWATLAKNLSQNKIIPQAIYFQHSLSATLSDTHGYTDFFRCPVYFDHDFNGIKIADFCLDIPLITVDDVINQALCHQADNMLNNTIEHSPIDSVYQFIINQLPLGLPEIEDVAKQLGMSVRTLQRKLNESGLNFTGMVDDIRKDLALSYLKNTNTKVIYIAQMLGFSEQSSFQRAFKRWMGATPKQYRNSE